MIYNVYPPKIQHNLNQEKSYFFMGDRWHLVGEIKVVTGNNGSHLIFPDMNKFIIENKSEGSVEWSIWGPRVN